MELKHFINKYRINHSLLAEKLEISRGAFSLKLREIHGQRLTEEQQEKLKLFILEFIEDAKSISLFK